MWGPAILSFDIVVASSLYYDALSSSPYRDALTALSSCSFQPIPWFIQCN